jgi:polysaccharide biosynthesis protein PslH
LAGAPRSIRRYAADPRIVVTGWVPQLAPYLQQATVAVSPLRYGVGVQNKVLEALATATPVVTDRRCLDALQAQPEHELLVAGDDRQFAAAIVGVLEDRALQQRLGVAGRAYVERAHRWSHSAATLLSAYQQALQPLAIPPSLGLRRPGSVLP